MWRSLKQLSGRTQQEPRRRQRSSLTRAIKQHAPDPRLAFAAAVALLGYAWLLAFPILAIYLLIDLPGTLVLADGPPGWAEAGIELAAALFCIWITVLLLRVKADNAKTGGMEIIQSEAPALFEHLATLYGAYGARPAHRVTLTGEMAIAMDYIPFNGFPFATRRHLRIGLPLLAALSPEHAKGALARVIGQSSLRHNPVTGWLHRLYEAWSHYQTLYRLQPKKVRWLLQLCFLWYAWLFTTIARHAVRCDELAGDRYALDTINDGDVVELISALTVYPRLLGERFWPPFRRLAYKHPVPPMGPYTRLLETLPTLLRRGEAERWLADALRRRGSALHPALAERLDNIGHDEGKLPMPPVGHAAAAAKLLGDALPELCARFDKTWLRENAIDWQERHAKYQKELKLLKALNSRAQHGRLEPREAWMHARLVAKHLDKSAAVPLFKRLVVEHPDNARHLVEAGRLLLGCGDAAGITALEHAMALDRRYRDQALRLIAAYRSALDRKAHAA